MYKFLLMAFLACGSATAQAAVTIAFTGTTYAAGPDNTTGGSFTRAHVDGATDVYTIDAAPQTVSGTVTLYPDLVGDNSETAPRVAYDGGGASFMTLTFTSSGATPVTFSGVSTAQALGSDTGLEFYLFNDDSTYSYAFSLFSLSTIPTKSYEGVLLPDFTQASDLSFTVTSQVGSYDSYTETVSQGAVTQISQVVDAVPETGTWAMLILGFGAVGAGLRRERRRNLAHA